MGYGNVFGAELVQKHVNIWKAYTWNIVQIPVISYLFNLNVLCGWNLKSAQ